MVILRNILLLVLAVGIASGCSSDSAWDCVKTEGTIIQETLDVPVFSKVKVHHRVQLFVAQGETQEVVLETGENMRDKISVSVTENTLEIQSDISCNFFRDYGITKVYVTTPDLEEIRHTSAYTVKSTGVLRFPELRLLSEDNSEATVTHTNGDFELELDVENLIVVANGKSNFFLSGMAERASLGLYSGDGRVEAAGLQVQHLTLFHRSSNKMVVHPRESIRGEIRSVGDVIAVHQPPVVEVETYFTGQLLFE